MSDLLSNPGEKLQALFAFIVLLGVVVTVHEWGHFQVARWCGVRVLRFSVGFGKPLWSRVGRDGTEYVVAMIPLGGYVKMLDEREAPVKEEDLSQAFNRKPVSQRFAIVAAGPLINLVLAVLVYWLLAVVGETRMAPVIGTVESGSPAAAAGLMAGDEIIALDDYVVRSWDDLPLRVAAHVGDTAVLKFRVRRGVAGEERAVNIPVQTFMHGHESDNPVAALGLRPWMPPYTVVIGVVLPEVEIDGKKIPGPGYVAGLQKGDRLLRVDGQAIDGVPAWVDAVRAAPSRPLQLEIERAGQLMQLQLTPAMRHANAQDATQTSGFAGVGAGADANLQFPADWPVEYRRDVRFGPLAAVSEALAATGERISLTVVMLGKMLTGVLSTESIGGPLTIAHGAGVTMSIGALAFLDFLALVSITIGILNLLPVPVLDGGHLVFYGIEAIRGKPVSDRVQDFATRIGLSLLLALMLLAFFNDYMRYLANP